MNDEESYRLRMPGDFQLGNHEKKEYSHINPVDWPRVSIFLRSKKVKIE